MFSYTQTIEEAKGKITVADIAREIFPGWKPSKSCRRPWGTDRHASFSVYDGGRKWKDHATGEAGDALDFLQTALDLDATEARRRFLEMAGTRQAPAEPMPAADDERAKARKRKTWEPMHPPTIEDLHAIATARHFPGTEGLEAAADCKTLTVGSAYGFPSWLLLSPCRRNAQARRLDGTPYQAGLKAKSLPGSIASLPIVSDDESAAFVVICEGGPDWLAILSAAVDADALRFVAVYGILGATHSLSADTLQALRRRRVRIFSDADTPGRAAADRWAEQVHHAGCRVDIWEPDTEGTDFCDTYTSPNGWPEVQTAFDFIREGAAK